MFVISPSHAQRNAIRLWRILKGFKGESRIYYALKANYARPLITALHKLNVGAEVMSVLEFELAIKCGIPTRRIIFTSPIKDDSCQKILNFRTPPLVVLDSWDEISWLGAASAHLKKRCPVAIRIDPLGPGDGKFGLSESEVVPLYKESYRDPNIVVVGLHFHLGTRTVHWKDYRESLSLTLALLKKLQSLSGSSVSLIDAGGGFPEEAEGLRLFSRIVAFLNNWKSRNTNSRLKFSVEPGRMLIANAGVFLSSVNHIKTLKGKKWIFTDIGINLLPDLKSARYEFTFLRSGGSAPLQRYYGIAGPLGMGHDKRRLSIEGVQVATGDILKVTNAGAYTLSLWAPFATGRPAVVVTYDGVHGRLIRQRDSLEQFL